MGNLKILPLPEKIAVPFATMLTGLSIKSKSDVIRLYVLASALYSHSDHGFIKKQEYYRILSDNYEDILTQSRMSCMSRDECYDHEKINQLITSLSHGVILTEHIAPNINLPRYIKNASPKLSNSKFVRYISQMLCIPTDEVRIRIILNFVKITDTIMAASTPVLSKRPIKLSYILEFLELCGGREVFQNFSTEEVCRQYVVPLTWRQQCSLSDTLGTQKDDSETQESAVYVIHSWNNSFLDLIDSLCTQYHPQIHNSTYLWIDLFCMNHHALHSNLTHSVQNSFTCVSEDEQFPNLSQILKQSNQILYIISNMSGFQSSIKNTWCLWQLYMLAKTQLHHEIRFDIQTPSNTPSKLEIESMMGASTANIDVERSACSAPIATTLLLQYASVEGIQFSLMNTMVSAVLWRWVERVGNTRDADSNQTLHQSDDVIEGGSFSLKEELGYFPQLQKEEILSVSAIDESLPVSSRSSRAGEVIEEEKEAEREENQRDKLIEPASVVISNTSEVEGGNKSFSIHIQVPLNGQLEVSPKASSIILPNKNEEVNIKRRNTEETVVPVVISSISAAQDHIYSLASDPNKRKPGLRHSDPYVPIRQTASPLHMPSTAATQIPPTTPARVSAATPEAPSILLVTPFIESKAAPEESKSLPESKRIGGEALYHRFNDSFADEKKIEMRRGPTATAMESLTTSTVTDQALPESSIPAETKQVFWPLEHDDGDQEEEKAQNIPIVDSLGSTAATGDEGLKNEVVKSHVDESTMAAVDANTICEVQAQVETTTPSQDDEFVRDKVMEVDAKLTEIFPGLKIGADEIDYTASDLALQAITDRPKEVQDVGDQIVPDIEVDHDVNARDEMVDAEITDYASASARTDAFNEDDNGSGEALESQPDETDRVPSNEEQAQDKLIRLYDEYESKSAELGEDHLDALVALEALAAEYLAQERLDDALATYMAYAERMVALKGDSDPETIAAIVSIAAIYSAQGKMEEAQSLYESCLEELRTVVGADHPDTLAAMVNLAVIHCNQKRYHLAEPLYREALAQYSAHLGEDHEFTQTCRNNLSLLYYLQAQTDDLEDSQINQYNVFAAFRYREEDRLSALRTQLQEQEDYVGILKEQILKEALEKRRKSLIESNDGLEESEDGEIPDELIGDIQQTKFEMLEVIREYQDCVEVPQDDSKLTDYLIQVAEMCQEDGQFSKAEVLFTYCYEDRLSKLSDDHPDTLLALQQLVLTYIDLGELSLAESSQRECLDGRERALGGTHPLTLGSVMVLVQILLLRDDYDEAIPLLTQLRDAYDAVMGAEYPATVLCKSVLNDLHHIQNGNSDESGVVESDRISPQRTDSDTIREARSSPPETRSVHLEEEEEQDSIPLRQDSAATAMTSKSSLTSEAVAQNELLVTIHRAYNLPTNPHTNQNPTSFVYFQIPGHPEMYTNAVASNCDPVFEETFSIPMSLVQQQLHLLINSNVCFSIIDTNIDDTKAGDIAADVEVETDPMVGSALVKLDKLIQGENISDSFPLIDSHGNKKGSLEISLNWKHEFQMTYDISPLTASDIAHLSKAFAHPRRNSRIEEDVTEYRKSNPRRGKDRMIDYLAFSQVICPPEQFQNLIEQLQVFLFDLSTQYDITVKHGLFSLFEGSESVDMSTFVTAFLSLRLDIIEEEWAAFFRYLDPNGSGIVQTETILSALALDLGLSSTLLSKLQERGRILIRHSVSPLQPLGDKPGVKHIVTKDEFLILLQAIGFQIEKEVNQSAHNGHISQYKSVSKSSLSSDLVQY